MAKGTPVETTGLHYVVLNQLFLTNIVDLTLDIDE
jgi:hypothetical protein